MNMKKLVATRSIGFLKSGDTYTVVESGYLYGGVPAVKLADSAGETFEMIGCNLADYFGGDPSMNATMSIARANSADLAFSRALTAAGLDRWDSFFRDYPPEVRAAYFAKIDADDARRAAMLGGR